MKTVLLVAWLLAATGASYLMSWYRYPKIQSLGFWIQGHLNRMG